MLTPADTEARILTAYLSGLSKLEVSELIGCSRNIDGVLKRNGIPSRSVSEALTGKRFHRVIEALKAEREDVILRLIIIDASRYKSISKNPESLFELLPPKLRA
jgi:hypothetical protein